MDSTIYNRPETQMEERYKKPCYHLTRNQLNVTHHDPNHPSAGQMIDFDDFLGLDKRGS